MARPSDYSDEVAVEICAQLAQGKSLNAICANEGMPSHVTVYSWLQKNEEFLKLYTRAREDQADTLADQIIDIADESHSDTYIDDNGNERTNTEVVQRSKLRVEARKWVAAKLKPKKYGDKLDLDAKVEHSGKIERIERVIVDNATDTNT